MYKNIHSYMEFELIFNINAGEKYYFDEIKFSNLDVITDTDVEKFLKKFENLKGQRYSFKKINSLINDLNQFTIRNDFVFLNANYNEIIKNKMEFVYDQ